MRKLDINNKGKVMAEDFHVNRTAVTRFGLWFNRLMPPRPLDSAAEYQVFRLLKGVNEEKQAKMVTELAYHEFIDSRQAELLLNSGKITSKPAILILDKLAHGGNGKSVVPAKEYRAIAPGNI